MHARCWFAALLLTFTGALPVHGQEETKPWPLERGFAPDKLYQFGDIDSVDLSSGTVGLTIPIGQRFSAGGGLSYGLVLTHSSLVWDFEERYDSYVCETGPPPVYCPTTYVQARMNIANNAGLGWMLSMGWLGDPEEPDDPAGPASTFVSPDGARHQFLPSLHRSGGSDSTTYNGYTYKYTRDGSYMRMKVNPDPALDFMREVQLGDGTVYTFESYNPQENTKRWRLKWIRDPYGNQVSVDYLTNPDRWVITDSQGRTHTVTFASMEVDGRTVPFVQSIDLAAFPGSTAHYEFQYTDTTISRSCNDTDPETSGTLVVRMLTGVVLPDGSTYGMSNYATSCSAGEPDVGMLGTLTLPTGGRIDWTYQRWAYSATASETGCILNPPVEDCVQKIRLQWAGIATKTITDPDGGPGATWQYGTQVVWTPSGDLSGVPLERRTRVTSPDLDDTIYYFRALPDIIHNQAVNDDSNYNRWDYSLPYTRRLPKTDTLTNQPAYLSVQYFKGPIAGQLDDDEIGGDLKRSVWVRYEHDQFDPALVTYVDEEPWFTNRQLAFRRVIYDDDGGVYADEKYFDFDGLGHYRTTVTDGTFASGNVRKSYRNSNPGRGTYKIDGNVLKADAADDQDWYPLLFGVESPRHNFTMIPASAPWILTTFDAEEDLEVAARARREYCFEASTGFLRAKRVLSGRTGANADLLAVYTRDGAGQLTNEQFFGGDAQAGNLPDNYCTTAATTTLSGAQYGLDHTYQYGVRATSQHHGAPYYDLDLTIDQMTGLVWKARDSAGLETVYTYDGQARLLTETPATTPVNGGARTTYIYHRNHADPPQLTNSAWVDVVRTPNNGAGTVLAEQRYLYDGLGRLSTERQLLPAGTFNQRVTTYDLMGRKASVSELQPDGTAGGGSRQTTYTYDLFGRPKVVTPPDTPDHAVTQSYTGVRETTRTVMIATTRNGSDVTETAVPTVETYDRQGRLSKVLEQKPGGTTITTTYGYDVGGHLASVLMKDDTAQQTQSRTFTYDNRGLLTSETLPEKGTSGNGTVSYPSYDARGHLRRSVDGGNDLTFTYDPATERLVDVRVTGAGTALETFTFAGANGTTPDGGTDDVKGKLQSTTRLNADGSSVGERFYYGGVGGRVSHRDTTWPGQSARLKVSWTDLGGVASLTYPQVAGIGAARSVCSSYANGWLTGITDAGVGSCPGGTSLALVSYHPNGMVYQVGHGNGVTDTYVKDPNDIGRPYRISSSNALSNWDSGSFEYDGAGNIKALRGMTEPVARPAPTRQQYTYDGFSNLTSITTDGSAQTIGIDSSTNRLSLPATYDPAGNLTHWTDYTYGYDPLNAMTTLSGGTLNTVYRYDADGERIAYREGATGPWTYSLRGLDGKVLREYVLTGSAWSWGKDVVYRSGQLLASIDGAGTRHFTLDHLGSPRLITDASRAVVEYHAYWGYGQEIDTGAGTERMKFTGHERDHLGTAAALDYMHARYYNPTVGRFLAVDEGNASMQDPQTWNRYTYARADPIKNLDPNGRLWMSYHFLVTLAAARFEGRTWGQSLKLAATSAWVDFKSGSMAPDAAHTNIHAMIGTVNGIPQTPEAADRAIGSLVQQGIAVGTDTSVGTALHTVQDLATPLHAVHQWPNLLPLSPSTAMNLVAHTVGDDFPSWGTLLGAFAASVAVLRADSSGLASGVSLPPPKPLPKFDCPVPVCRDPNSVGQWMRQTPDGR